MKQVAHFTAVSGGFDDGDGDDDDDDDPLPA
jgi:hypothetical protein